MQIAEKLLELVPAHALTDRKPWAMRNIKLTLSYDGTDFHGWQRQPGLRTIQQVLENALDQLTGAADFDYRVQPNRRRRPRTRTVVHFLTISRHSPETFVRALNALLPARRPRARRPGTPQAFHATLDARSKRYRYAIDNGPIASPFQLRYSWHVHRPLDAAAMAAAGRRATGPARFPQLRDRLAQPDEQRANDPRPAR